MSYTQVPSLRSTAHPLIVNLGLGVEKDKEFVPHLRLPYPEIDPAWNGFEISYLHWLGYKKPNLKGRKLTDRQWQILVWQYELMMNHEFSHSRLDRTPSSLLIKNAQFHLIRRIRETFEAGKEEIPVPLDPDNPGNALEKQWALMFEVHSASRLAHEVFAVRSSLLDTPAKGIVTHDYRKFVLATYKEKYEKLIPAFSEAYELFDFVANKIGETVATAMIYNVFGTGHPDAAFAGILLYLMKQPDKCMDFLATLSGEEADLYFSSVTNKLDPNDSRLQRKNATERAAEIEKNFSIEPQLLEDNYASCTLSSPMTFLFSNYSDFIYPPEVHLFGNGFTAECAPEALHGFYPLLLESVRQQYSVPRKLDSWLR